MLVRPQVWHGHTNSSNTRVRTCYLQYLRFVNVLLLLKVAMFVLIIIMLCLQGHPFHYFCGVTRVLQRLQKFVEKFCALLVCLPMFVNMQF